MICRICKNKKLSLILDYKKVALSGSFLKKNNLRSEKKYDLKLLICNKCSHIQINNLINPDLLFKKYLWETGISESNNKLIQDLVNDLSKYKKRKSSKKIFEIASNDGTCLKILNKKYNASILGIDPAKNIVEKANINNIRTINNYFSYSFSKKIKKKFDFFDFCIARNVIAHVHDPVDIFNGVRNILKDTGFFVIEFPHLLNIFIDCQYDNVFHEHVGFHSLKSIDDICNITQMKIIDVKKINSQGGSLRVFISKNLNLKKNISVKKILDEELDNKLTKTQSWIVFKKRVFENRNKIKKILENLKNKGKKISIYGASGKGQALLQFINSSKKFFDKVYDKSQLKQKLYTPGTHFLIDDPKKIYDDKPDYLFLCSWNLVDEIKKEQKKYIARGGRFIIPFPRPKIVS